MALFCANLQKLLGSITELTRKGIPFEWGKEQPIAFEEITKMSNPPVLHLPRSTERFILYTDTSRKFRGSCPWQEQEEKPCLVGYASKTLSTACLNYMETELEMTGLLVNMGLWKTLLKRHEFDAPVDHLVVVHILKARTKPAIPRIIRLLDHLSSCSFNFYFVKGKDMVLVDYFRRHRESDNNPYGLVPVHFCYYEIYLSHLGLHTFNVCSTRSKTSLNQKLVK